MENTRHSSQQENRKRLLCNREAEVEPNRELYLAVSEEVATGLFEEPLGELLLKNHRVRLLVFNSDAEVIVKWIA